jgi:hypothetical protein
MDRYRIAVLLGFVSLLVVFWSDTASPQATQPESTAHETRRGYLALGVGANLAAEGSERLYGTAAASFVFPTVGALSVQVDVGVWEVEREYHKSSAALRIGLALRYDVPVADEISIYPKVGAGFVFVPDLNASFGCGVSYLLSQKTGVFLEAGGHIAYRQSQLRANYYFLATYFSAGLTFH